MTSMPLAFDRKKPTTPLTAFGAFSAALPQTSSQWQTTQRNPSHLTGASRDLNWNSRYFHFTSLVSTDDAPVRPAPSQPILPQSPGCSKTIRVAIFCRLSGLFAVLEAARVCALFVISRTVTESTRTVAAKGIQRGHCQA
jgi:hypothetical protein